MRVKLPIDISNLTVEDPQFISFLSQIINAMVTILNGDISFSDNFRGRIVNVVFNAANTQQAINHSLNKIPTGYLNIGSKAATQLYNGVTASTTQTIWLQSTAATTVNVLIF